MQTPTWYAFVNTSKYGIYNMNRNLTANESIYHDQVQFGGLHHFAAVYAPIHEPLVLIICELFTGYCRTFAGLMGIPCHIACMLTLSGRRLFSATNATLISLSLSQLLLILVSSSYHDSPSLCRCTSLSPLCDTLRRSITTRRWNRTRG